MNAVTISMLSGLAAVVYGFILSLNIVKLPTGTPDMNEIAKAIAEGAQARLRDAAAGAMLAALTAGVAAARAIPKSRIFTAPVYATMMFVGETSRWTIPSGLSPILRVWA